MEEGRWREKEGEAGQRQIEDVTAKRRTADGEKETPMHLARGDREREERRKVVRTGDAEREGGGTKGKRGRREREKRRERVRAGKRKEGVGDRGEREGILEVKSWKCSMAVGNR